MTQTHTHELVTYLFTHSFALTAGLWQFYCAHESVVLMDIHEQSKAVKQALDTISELIEENSSFETNYRRFTCEVLKVTSCSHSLSHTCTHSHIFSRLTCIIHMV
jgi:hypothetical protein